jgi:hypothetical protein
MDNATPTSSFILTTYWWMKPSLSSLASLFFNEGYTLGQELFLIRTFEFYDIRLSGTLLVGHSCFKVGSQGRLTASTTYLSLTTSREAHAGR